MYSETLKRFKELIRNDNRWPHKSKKFENERRELLFWFVGNCLSSKGPENARGFDDYGIKCPSDYTKLKKRILVSVDLQESITYKYFESGIEMENLIGDFIDLYNKRHKAIIYFTKDTHKQMDSLYTRMRNSFAHGNYFKVKDYYILWNETGRDTKKLGSFMMLKFDHLRDIYRTLGSQ